VNQKSNQEPAREHVKHTFAPVYNSASKILILGSFPSVKSREQGFYYGHPQNRFWKVVAEIFSCEIPQTIEEKKNMILNANVAIWDVIDSCDIIGSSDSSIQNVIPNDLSIILNHANIDKIYANGKTAAKLYEKYSQNLTGINIITLPSTSPANAAYTLKRLIESWKQIL
jgi:hypoxanthine-DNA glycosylase